ncbi:MAG: DUF1007 family protein [Rhodobacteraceae bacterium]|nr:DUF1007 family protein [Paracoccaceae bacterium]
MSMGQSGRRFARIGAAVLAVALGPTGALAHPHVFVDTGLNLHFDEEGRLAAIRVIWVYDEFTTLWLLDEAGLDPDFSGSLTDEERDTLARLDTNWDADFKGDLFLWQGGEGVALSRPMEPWADLRDGRAVTSHLRALPERMRPGPGAALEIAAYDPTFFTAYHLIRPVEMQGAPGCAVRVDEADLDAAYAQLEERLDAIPPDLWEAEFPEVGHLFADRVVVTCDVSG